MIGGVVTALMGRLGLPKWAATALALAVAVAIGVAAAMLLAKGIAYGVEQQRKAAVEEQLLRDRAEQAERDLESRKAADAVLLESTVRDLGAKAELEGVANEAVRKDEKRGESSVGPVSQSILDELRARRARDAAAAAARQAGD